MLKPRCRLRLPDDHNLQAGDAVTGTSTGNVITRTCACTRTTPPQWPAYELFNGARTVGNKWCTPFSFGSPTSGFDGEDVTALKSRSMRPLPRPSLTWTSKIGRPSSTRSCGTLERRHDSSVSSTDAHHSNWRPSGRARVQEPTYARWVKSDPGTCTSRARERARSDSYTLDGHPL